MENKQPTKKQKKAKKERPKKLSRAVRFKVTILQNIANTLKVIKSHLIQKSMRMTQRAKSSKKKQEDSESSEIPKKKNLGKKIERFQERLITLKKLDSKSLKLTAYVLMRFDLGIKFIENDYKGIFTKVKKLNYFQQKKSFKKFP